MRFSHFDLLYRPGFSASFGVIPQTGRQLTPEFSLVAPISFAEVTDLVQAHAGGEGEEYDQVDVGAFASSAVAEQAGLFLVIEEKEKGRKEKGKGERTPQRRKAKEKGHPISSSRESRCNSRELRPLG